MLEELDGVSDSPVELCRYLFKYIIIGDTGAVSRRHLLTCIFSLRYICSVLDLRLSSTAVSDRPVVALGFRCTAVGIPAVLQQRTELEALACRCRKVMPAASVHGQTVPACPRFDDLFGIRCPNDQHRLASRKTADTARCCLSLFCQLGVTFVTCALTPAAGTFSTVADYCTGWARVIPVYHTFTPPWSSWSSCGIRHHQVLLLTTCTYSPANIIQWMSQALKSYNDVLVWAHLLAQWQWDQSAQICFEQVTHLVQEGRIQPSSKLA